MGAAKVGAAEVGAAETQGHRQERIILGILGRNPFNQNSMDIGNWSSEL